MQDTPSWSKVYELKKRLHRRDSESARYDHDSGKLTARDCVVKLMDQSSFIETSAWLIPEIGCSGFVTGYGTVKDRPVCFAASDGSGAMDVKQYGKVCAILDKARLLGAPVVIRLNNEGILQEENMAAMAAYAAVTGRLVRLSGVCPLIAYLSGACMGADALLARLCDVTVLTMDGDVRSMLPAEFRDNAFNTELPEPSAENTREMAARDAVSYTAEDENDAIEFIVRLLDTLPSHNLGDAPIFEMDDVNRRLQPWDGLDIVSLVHDMVDTSSVIALSNAYGQGAYTALCRFGGRSAGLIAYDETADGGCLTARAAVKAARFIRFCDCFSLPVVTLLRSQNTVNPAVFQKDAPLNAAAQLTYAYADATCPKVMVLIGPVLGLSLSIFGCMTADVRYAWPHAFIGSRPQGHDTQVPVITVQTQPNNEDDATLATHAEQPVQDEAGAIPAAKTGLIDDIIEPESTRQFIIASLEMLASKRETGFPKKHGNMPL